MKADSEKLARTTLFKKILERRLPQILFIYLGVCWTVLEFLSWMVEHFSLSSYFVDLSFVVLISMIPSVGLLAWFHGRPGKDEWSRIEKIGIPINLLVTVILVLSIFSGKNLSATTKVVVKDEAGQTHERVILKSGHQKSVLVFFFHNESADTSLDYLQYAITDAIYFDLIQDYMVNISTAQFQEIQEECRKLDFAQSTNLPLPLMLKIAQERHEKYFVTGSFNHTEDNYFLTAMLYETANGNQINALRFEGQDILNLVDQLSNKLRQDMSLSSENPEQITDMPIAEIMTHSLPALKYYTIAQNTIDFFNDYDQGIALYQKAIAEDPGFAIAHLELFIAYFLSNRRDQGLESIRLTMQYQYKLPERIKFVVKYYYYIIEENREKQLAVLKMWSDLYPDDVLAHEFLGGFYRGDNQLDESIREFATILKIAPEQKTQLRVLGQLCALKGDIPTALEYYNQYITEFPNNTAALNEIARIYFLAGDYAKARSYYSSTLIIEPEEPAAQWGLANIEATIGNFGHSLELYEQTLKVCKTAPQKAAVYQALEQQYELRGQLRKSIEYRNKRFAEERYFRPPLQLLRDKLLSLVTFAKIDKAEKAFAQLAEFQVAGYLPNDRILPYVLMEIYLELDMPDSAEVYKSKVDALNALAGQNPEWADNYRIRGKIAEIRQEYREAIRFYEKQHGLDPLNASVFCNIGCCYRRMGNLRRARRAFEQTLAVLPNDPMAHYQLGLVFKEEGKLDLARRHFDATLEMWRDADPEFKPRQMLDKELEEANTIS
jgi:tetratricopeptide (TPR) repeat protein